MRLFRRATGPVHPACHRLVHRLWKEMHDQRVSQEDVAERAGVSSSGMRKWRNGSRQPNLNDVEACLNVLGLEITVRNAA